MTIYVTSDWHMGDEHCNIPKILSLLDLVSEDNLNELILCGDIYDLWLMDYAEIITTEPFKTVHKRLLDLAEKNLVIYLIGNHDADIDSKLKYTNIKFATYCIKDNIYFMHGNQYDEEQQKISFFYRVIIFFFPKIYKRFFKTPAQLINNPVEYKDRCKTYHDKLRSIITEYGFNYLVCGHSHNPLLDGKLVDCGDFVNHCSFVVFEKGIPTLVDL